MTDPNFDIHLERLRLAVGSLLDIVREMAVAMEINGQADKAWTELVMDTIRQHKKELGFEP